MRDLVVRAREGDRDAFSELAARSLGRLTAVARMILRDEYAAQDAVQEAFIEAWKSLPGLRDPDRFDAWMRRLLVRACFRGATRSRRIGAVNSRHAARPIRGARAPLLCFPIGIGQRSDSGRRVLPRGKQSKGRRAARRPDGPVTGSEHPGPALPATVV